MHQASDNQSMTLTGHIQNGAVVFDGNPVLPEGASVVVSIVHPSKPPKRGRVQVPLVRTSAPESVKLTNERIAEIFEEDDIASARR